MRIKDFKRLIFHRIARTLWSWSETIMMELETEEEEKAGHTISLPSRPGSRDGKARANQGGKQIKNMVRDRRISAGPPEHWARLVRRAAPDLLRPAQEAPEHEHGHPEPADMEDSAPGNQQHPITHEAPRTSIPPVKPGKKEIPRHRRTAPKAETSEKPNQRLQLAADDKTAVSASPEREREIHQRPSAAPGAEVPKPQGELPKRAAKEATILSELPHRERKVPQRLRAEPKSEPSVLPGERTEMAAEGKATTSEPSRHEHPARHKKDHLHDFNKEASPAFHPRDTGKELPHHISPMWREPSSSVEPGVIVGATRKSIPAKHDTFRDKPSTAGTPQQRESQESTTYGDFVESAGEPEKRLWPELPKEAPTRSSHDPFSSAASRKPAGDLWPELPETPPVKAYDEWIANIREEERLLRLDAEQRGMSWNA